MITLTEKALQYVTQLIAKSPSTPVYRISVKPSGGCSGLLYEVNLVEKSEEGDQLFTQSNGLVVCVPAKSYPFIQGMTVDYVREGVSSKLQFRNDNAKGTCGCGESFNV